MDELFEENVEESLLTILTSTKFHLKKHVPQSSTSIWTTEKDEDEVCVVQNIGDADAAKSSPPFEPIPQKLVPVR
ncbi:unnamed protein product [Sphenostylis stenocarpa]|uniref:Uncharacterized protein n=1 Tax=Sphenostylis stenocarpa TaxID=92480 RepID=A0AA86TK27_9FABA|nr:unnamed protein product [Sphenostylis stenocarpa]